MKLIRVLSFAALCVLATVSCNKNGEQGYPGDFLNCALQQNWTAESSFNQLLGKWQLTYSGTQTAQLPVENVILIFTDDAILRVFNDGQPVLTTHFYIQQQDAQTYGIFTSDPSPYTDGRLLFCGSEMECNGSYTGGGTDHYYRKAQ